MSTRLGSPLNRMRRHAMKTPLTVASLPLRHYRIHARVYLGDYDIKTWYHSPYPLDEDHSSVGSSANVSATHGYRTSSATSKVKIRIKNGPRSSKNGCAWSDPSSSENRPSEGLTDAVGTAQAQNGSSPSTPASIAATSSAAIASAIPAPKIPHLWICEGCFKYMRTYAGWNSHRRGCPHRHPPGRKVYQRGAHIIWEVDGAKEKLYAQNLSLFGKLFIDHKTIFFDVEPFLFYVITDASANFDYVLGFFSKEKVSYDNYNLAVIITFPPFQKKGFGTLMIEFSYLLSAQAAIFGTPERPLSELGFKGYASYWSAAVLRTLALAFNETDSEVASRLLSNGTHTAGSPHKASDSAAAHNSSFPRASAGNVSRAQRKASTKARSILLGLVDLTRQDAFSDALFAEGLAKRLEDDDKLTAEELADLRKVRRSALGFAGEVPRALAAKLASLPASPNRQGFVSVAQEPGETTGTADQTDRNDLRKNGIAAPSVHEGVAHSRTALDRGAQHSTPNYKTTIKPFTTPAAALTAEATLPRSRAAVLDELCTSDGFALATTLERLSQAANLRVEDATFALSECGLLSQRLPSLPMGVHSGPASNDVAWSRDASGDAARSPGGVEDGFLDNGGERPFILITRSAVRRAILERGIKRPVLDPQYVFL